MLMEDSHLGLIILYKHYFFIYFISEFPYKIHIILSLQSAYKKKKKKKKRIPKWKQILLLKFMCMSLLKSAADFCNIITFLPF